MNKEDQEKVIKFIDRGVWKNSWHLLRESGGEIDMSHPDNIKRVRELIAAAKSEAYSLKTEAESIERVMANMERTDDETVSESG